MFVHTQFPNIITAKTIVVKIKKPATKKAAGYITQKRNLYLTQTIL
jgi:hypothetical protein